MNRTQKGLSSLYASGFWFLMSYLAKQGRDSSSQGIPKVFDPLPDAKIGHKLRLWEGRGCLTTIPWTPLLSLRIG